MTSRTTTAAAIALVAGLAFIAGRASDGLVAPGARAAQPEGQWAPPAPGPMHEHLKQMVGAWEGSVRFRMGPGEDWMESTGTIRRELAMGGRFVIERVTGEGPGGEDFKGMGIVGYNDMEGHYESVWIENMANHMSMATGTYDANTKTFTFKGDMIDMTGQKQKTVMTLDASDPDKEVSAGYIINADGSRTKNFEGTFTRTGN
ncbi:MAG: DUF1579 family protein [Phycisphaerales bacterium JB039]